MSAPTIPGLVTPGQIEKQFQKQPQIRDSSGGPVVPLRQQQIPEQAEKTRFILKSVQLEGFSVLSPDEISESYNDLVNEEVSLADIYRIAYELTAKYRTKGYILSQVFVPVQQIKDGLVQLQAVEGFIDEVKIDALSKDKRGLVLAFAEKIKSTRPLTSMALERYMLLINDLPGIKARAVLSRSEKTFAAANLTIQAVESNYSGSLSLDNRGGRSLGPYRAFGSVTVDNVLGVFDSTTFQVVQSNDDELTYLYLSHEQQLGSEGGKLLFDISSTDSDPEELAFIPLEQETESQTINLNYSYPVLRSRNSNFYLRGGIRFHESETSLFGIKIIEDKLRVLNVGLTYDFLDKSGGSNLFDAQISQGLTGLGASDEDDIFLSVLGAEVDFTKLNVFAARLQPINNNWSVLTAFTGQFTNDTLLSPEQFSFGGVPFGRGYDPSEKVADNGTALKVELQYKDKGPYQLYSFYDVGWVWNTDELPNEDNDHTDSFGIGANVSFGSNFSANFELAKPLNKDVAAEGNNDLRGYFGLTAFF